MRILICPRERAQDVGKIVKKLEEAKLEKTFVNHRGNCVASLAFVAYTQNL